MLSGNWDGLEFCPVKNYKTKKVIPDLYQLHVEQIIPFEAIALNGHEKVKMCGHMIERVGIHFLLILYRMIFINSVKIIKLTED